MNEIIRLGEEATAEREELDIAIVKRGSGWVTQTTPAASYVGSGARTRQFPISADEEQRRKKLTAQINEGRLFRDPRVTVDRLLSQGLERKEAAGERPTGN